MHRLRWCAVIVLLASLLPTTDLRAQDPALAPTPPMGRNSWDSYGTTVGGDQIKANVDVMARDVAQHGWKYIVVDIQWYEPNAQATNTVRALI
ncbi:MAG TPA: hypothetical protein VJR04_05430 [Terriglobales bacterium]|nr:hypothetical protein [Terriglobales bacterium]